MPFAWMSLSFFPRARSKSRVPGRRCCDQRPTRGGSGLDRATACGNLADCHHRNGLSCQRTLARISITTSMAHRAHEKRFCRYSLLGRHCPAKRSMEAAGAARSEGRGRCAVRDYGRSALRVFSRFVRRRSQIRRRAVATVRQILDSRQVTVVPQSRDSFLAALSRYAVRETSSTV